MLSRPYVIRALAVLPAIVLLAAACGGASNSAASRSSGSVGQQGAAKQSTGSGAVTEPRPAAAATAASAAVQAAAPSAAGATDASLPDPTAGGAAGLDRKIIRNAELGLMVKDSAGVPDAIAGIAAGLGGYVAASQLVQNGDQLAGTLTVRVPAERFDDAMAQFRHLGVKVQHEDVSSQDVTQEYTDLNARVRNLEATQDQLRLLLATVREKSNNTQDILTVYRELNTISGQIEQAKGRQQYLDKLSTLATINLQLIPIVAAPAPPQLHRAWSPARTLTDALIVLRNLGRTALEALIWIAIVVVPLGALAAIIAGLILSVRRATLRRRTTP